MLALFKKVEAIYTASIGIPIYNIAARQLNMFSNLYYATID